MAMPKSDEKENYADIEFAKVDTARSSRTGRTEVVFALGKTPEQVASIMKTLAETEPLVIATKVSPEQAAAIQKTFDGKLTYYETAQILCYKKSGYKNTQNRLVAVLSGGTSDIPIAEEAAVAAELYGCEVMRIYDVGIAGIHRLLAQIDKIKKADAIIAVAGMEGALPSVVAGLVPQPIIAVPTSVGYGTSMKGVTALLAMLNGCSLGVSVVNIDNGFGAGYIASQRI